MELNKYEPEIDEFQYFVMNIASSKAVFQGLIDERAA